MKCAVVSEVAPSILPLTIMLILYPYTFPPLHTLFSLIPTDHEITHRWSGNPHSWDSIYQHQRKPQRLLVKLLTNKFNTKIFRDLVARATTACHTSVFVASAKMTQVTSRSNKKNFSTSKASNLFDICSDSFKLRSNMYSRVGPKMYGKKV